MSIAYDYSHETSRDAAVILRKQLLIDGQHVESVSGRTFNTLNPATGQVIATISEGNEADVERAVAAARRAFEGVWSTMRPAERGHILFRLAELMKQHSAELAELESRDAGKPISAVLRQDLPAAIDTLTYYAGWADKIHGDTVPTRSDALTYTVREPVGVVAVIVPWNFPLMIGMWKLAPALACGCTVVMKPAELTSLSALRIGELALEAGLPPGVFNIVPGPGRIVGDALVNHPDVDKVTFTGSPGVGRGILRGAAGNFKRVSLELGGKSANVIFDDADLDAATKAAAAGHLLQRRTGVFGGLARAGSREGLRRSGRAADCSRRGAAYGRYRREDDGARSGDFREADEVDSRLRGHRPEGRCNAGYRRSACRRSRLLHQPGRVREREARDADFAGGNLRPCRQRHQVQGRSRCIADCQRHGVQSRGWRVEPRHRPRAAFCEEGEGRHGLDQHLRLHRCAIAMGRFGRLRLRPRARHRSTRELHRAESGLDEPERLRVCLSALPSRNA